MPGQKPRGSTWGVVNSLLGLFAGLYLGSWILKELIYPGATDIIAYERIVSDFTEAPIVFWQAVALLSLSAATGFLAGLSISFAQLWLNQRAYSRAVREVARSKDAFISMVLHHIRTPLTGIKWVLAALGGENQEKMLTPENLRALKLENERAITAVNELLEAARVSSAQATYQFEIRPVPEVFALFDEIAKAAESLAAAKHIALKVSLIPPPPDTYIAIDKEKLQIIFEGLLNNAIKYTPENGSVSATMSVIGHRLNFTVADTGIGIPPEQQSKVFGQFFRADNARVKEPDGFGVGLFIGKTFVERMGGTIAFTSTLGKGTTFSVELPLVGAAGERFLAGITTTPVSTPQTETAPRG